MEWLADDEKQEVRELNMSASASKLVESPELPEPSSRDGATRALTTVRHGIITGEGPTTKGRVHFSRSLDAIDAAWCARILTAPAIDHLPVSREEAEALFEIDEAATERSDGGHFDDLLAKAVAHHAAAASGFKVPPRSVALSRHIDIESWAPGYASRVNTDVLQWLASRLRGRQHNNGGLTAMVATFLGVTVLPLAHQLPYVFDIGL